MTSRSFRLETRSRAKDEMKRIIQTIEKVRKWERKWVDLGLSNSLRVYKWVPIRDDKAEEDDEDKENEPIELTDNPTSSDQGASGEHTLPDISQVPQSSSGISAVAMESPQVLSDQLPPDVLLTSDDPKEPNPSSPSPGDQTPPTGDHVDASRSAEAPAVRESGGEAGTGDVSEMDVDVVDQDHPEPPSPRDKSASPSAHHDDRQGRGRSREKQPSPALNTQSRSRSRSPH